MRGVMCFKQMIKKLAGVCLLVVVGCSTESLSPQAKFTFEAEEESTANARVELHKLAIENNLFFEDHSHNYPSGNSTVLAKAERADGLILVLLGDGADNQVTIAVHCHDKCTNWKPIYSIALERFGKKWQVKNI